MSTQARLQLLAARAREATALRQADQRPASRPRPLAGEPCPGCSGGCHVLAGVLTCPDCGEYRRDGRGGWSQRGHSGGLVCREVLGLAAPLLPDMPARTVLHVEREGRPDALDATDDLIASELRAYVGTVAQWLEGRGEWLRGVEVHDG
jgi:hypothetical protein